jgi:hypothetical protein
MNDVFVFLKDKTFTNFSLVHGSFGKSKEHRRR